MVHNRLSALSISAFARTVAVATLITALGCGLKATASSPPLGSRSFLSRHVSSVRDLQDELDRDPRLIRIYSELLHMSPAQVKSEFSRLKMIKLQEEGVYKIYGARTTADGSKYSFKVRRLPRGSAIFTLEDGRTPVILRQCGNLLRGYYDIPSAMASNIPRFNVLNPDAGLPAAPGPAPAAITLDSPISGDWDWVEDTNATAPPPSYIAPPLLAASIAPLWWPWLFPLVGVPFIGGGGRGTTPTGPGTVINPPGIPSIPSTPTTPTTPTIPTVPIVPIIPEVPIIPTPPANVVPEPGIAAWLAAVTALGGIAALRRVRRGSGIRK